MVLGTVLIVVGIVFVIGARWIGGVMDKANADQLQYSSLLSQDSVKRLQDMCRSRESAKVTVLMVRVFGAFAFAAGIGAIVSSLSK